MWRYAESLELPYAAVPFLDPTGWLKGPLDEIRTEKRLTGYKQNAKLVSFLYDRIGSTLDTLILLTCLLGV
jgi:hypothetical protein